MRSTTPGVDSRMNSRSGVTTSRRPVPRQLLIDLGREPPSSISALQVGESLGLPSLALPAPSFGMGTTAHEPAGRGGTVAIATSHPADGRPPQSPENLPPMVFGKASPSPKKLIGENRALTRTGSTRVAGASDKVRRRSRSAPVPPPLAIIGARPLSPVRHWHGGRSRGPFPKFLPY